MTHRHKKKNHTVGLKTTKNKRRGRDAVRGNIVDRATKKNKKQQVAAADEFRATAKNRCRVFNTNKISEKGISVMKEKQISASRNSKQKIL